MVGAGTDHTKTPERGGPAIILVRPQLAVNIGMAARAMANFGLHDLRLVAPKHGWPRQDGYEETAAAAAAGALHLLDAARVFATLEEAVADLTAVYATTARERGQGKPVLAPDDAMAAWSAPIAAGERRGILFGPERTGLDSDEVALADAVVTFRSILPTARSISRRRSCWSATSGGGRRKRPFRSAASSGRDRHNAKRCSLSSTISRLD